ncbi:hypothetical protein CORC01_03092 [Colletotrichum orchidophilum]|uniref:Uncharacterized protein n=1 Tax=Colletotrichum orchidophilum TaxID=1209926 RepID=A0A1G4BJH9_9PEZI|nr:uncharacterized protein CORC01_03092 [Colletotrichum orchidophilum]OHF01602.1 hypothetical protein CORC01_03092 [Colletotrichum orchidophilum]
MATDADPETPIGYANAPQSPWGSPGTNGAGFSAVSHTAQPWTYHNANTSMTRHWTLGRFTLFGTSRNAANGSSNRHLIPVRAQVRPASSWTWYNPENGGTLIFVGHVVLVIFEVIALVISSQSLERVKKFSWLVHRADFVSTLSLISMCVEVGVGIMATLVACSCVGMALSVAFAALLCLNATATGSYLIFAMKTNLDKALCDQYGDRASECWAGLRMGMAVGVFRVLLL